MDARQGRRHLLPLGAWITTAEELPDEIDLRLRTYVNGELRQDAWTSQMLFSPEQIVAHIQEVARLEPGDLILMGTPEGVGWGCEPRVCAGARRCGAGGARSAGRDRARVR